MRSAVSAAQSDVSSPEGGTAGDYPCCSVRQPFAVIAGALVASLGALVLGEYDPTGATPYIAGVLFGVAVAEAIVAVARRSTTALMVVAAMETALGLTWAAWIAAAHHWEWVPGSEWLSIGVGAVAAVAWIRTSGRSRSEDDSPIEQESGVDS